MLKDVEYVRNLLDAKLKVQRSIRYFLKFNDRLDTNMKVEGLNL